MQLFLQVSDYNIPIVSLSSPSYLCLKTWSISDLPRLVSSLGSGFLLSPWGGLEFLKEMGVSLPFELELKSGVDGTCMGIN